MQQRSRLKYHGAHKKVSYLDDNGILVKPETPNAIKAETFVFDALTLGSQSLAYGNKPGRGVWSD